MTETASHEKLTIAPQRMAVALVGARWRFENDITEKMSCASEIAADWLTY
jgi:hypothetical protein